MAQTLTQDIEVERRPLLTLDEGAPPHSGDYLEGKAAKLHLGLGEQSPGIPELSTALSQDNAEVYRRILRDQDHIQKIRTQNDLLSSILESDPSSITPEVVSVVHGLSAPEMASPEVGDIIEKKYAQLFTNTVAADAGNDILDEAIAADPEATHQVLDRAEALVYKMNVVQGKLDEARKNIEDQSWPGTVYNVLESAVIGNYQTYNQVGANADLDNLSNLPGQNRIEGYAFLWGLSDPVEFEGYVDAIATDLKSRNPYAFQEWMDGLVSFGNSDANTNNLFVGLDVAGIVPVGKLAKLFKTGVKAATITPTKLPELTGALGKALDSGVGKIASQVADGTFLKGIRKGKELEDSIPNIMAPDQAMSGGTLMSKASYTRLTDALMENAEYAKKILADVNQMDRMTPEEVVSLKDTLAKQFRDDHPQIGKSVINVESVDPDLGNVYNAKITIANRDGSLFESAEQAEAFAKTYLKTNEFKVTQAGDPKITQLSGDSFKIEQYGEGFQIEVMKTLDESSLFDLKLGTGQTTPTSLTDFSSKLGWLRTPVENLSTQQNVARSVITTSKEQIDQLFSEMTKPIGALSKKELSEMDDLMFINQKQQKFYENVGQLEQAFYDRYKKAPSEKQVSAYFAYTNVSDLDLMIRDLGWYRQKAAQGFEDISIDVTEGTQKTRINFEGKVVDRLPYESKDPFTVAIIENGQIKSSKYSTSMGAAGREAIQKLVDDGYKIINAVESDFKIGKKYYDYVITKGYKRDRVGVKNVDRKPGGHKIVRYPYYIKQAKIAGDEGLKFYRGDKTFWNFRTEKEANTFLETLETARQKLLRQDPDAVKYLRDNIPVNSKEFLKAVSDGDIDLSTPFTTTRSGTRTIDKLKNLNLRDVTKSEHKPGDRLMGRFAGERSEADINTIRSESNNQFRVEAAEYLSPLEAMKSASSDMVSTRMFDDYKLMSARNFIREFGDVLKGDLNTLKADGLAVIQKPEFIDGAEMTPSMSKKVARAKNVARAFNTLMDNSDAFSRKVELAKERLVSSVMPKFGPRGQEWLAENMMSRTKDPSVYFKSAAFHSKMGFWNPVQYFKQINSAVNIASIGGVEGVKSVVAYPFLRLAIRTNSPELIASAGRKAQALGLQSEKDFVESINLYKKSGFNDIGGDVAYLDDLRSPELVQTPLKRGTKAVLKTSATPFYEGERMARLSAFNAAYKERKALLGGKALTRRDEAAILFRAKTMIGNMTREANAPWQKGYASVMTQFFGYQARIMEQMLGKQLTGAEKARLFAGYSMMYGAPTAVGATVGIVPVREMVLDYMYANGMDPNDPVAQPFLDGFISGMTNYMFDKDWDIAATYGPNGLPTFYDMYRGDKDFADFVLGASGGIALDTVKAAWPLATGVMSEVSDFEGGWYNLTTDDWLKPLRNITTINSAAQMYQVYNFGTWASKNGFDIAKMDLPDAVMAALTGVKPGSIEDTYAKMGSSKGLKQAREEAQKDIIDRLRKARKLESSDTREMIIRGLKVEMESWGFTPDEKTRISKYATDSKTLEDIALDQYEKEMRRLGLDQGE